MKVILDIPDFDRDKGMTYQWKDGFVIKTALDGGSFVISANKAGLESLGHHLFNLAQDLTPSGYHLHLDDSNSLEEGSIELIIEKTE